MNKEGFWYSKYEPELPMPIASDIVWEGKREFLRKLYKVEQCSMTRERSYKGSSNCRICNEQNGSKEYSTRDWTWPAGFAHYIEKHNVKPTDEFISYIMNVTINEPEFVRKLK